MILALFFVLASDPPPDASTMVSYLRNVLAREAVYPEPFPENVMFIFEDEDSTTCTGSFDHFFDIVLKADQSAKTGVDPNTAPVLDRFRVYIDGTVLWWSPIPGMYVPLEDFINGITEL